MMSGRWLRIAPEDSSTPLHTMSYWNALMVSGSCVFSASSPPCGMLNGLWLKSTCPVSSFSSYIGKSVIQQKRNAPFSHQAEFLGQPGAHRAGEFRRRLDLAGDEEHRVARGSAPQAARIASARSASRLRAIGPFGPSAS